MQQESKTPGQLYYFSPAFQCYTSPPFYKNLLTELEWVSSVVDQCSEAARLIIWKQLFILVGTPLLSSDKPFSIIIKNWSESNTVNLLAIELLYLAFATALDKYPNLIHDYLPKYSPIAKLPINVNLKSLVPQEQHTTYNNNNSIIIINGAGNLIESSYFIIEVNGKIIEFPKDQLRTTSDISSTFTKLIDLQAWKASLDDFGETLKTSIFNILVYNLPGNVVVDCKSFTNSINLWAQDIKSNIQLINRLHVIIEHLIDRNCITNLHLTKSSAFPKASESYPSPPSSHLCFVSCTSPDDRDPPNNLPSHGSSNQLNNNNNQLNINTLTGSPPSSLACNINNIPAPMHLFPNSRNDQASLPHLQPQHQPAHLHQSLPPHTMQQSYVVQPNSINNAGSRSFNGNGNGNNGINNNNNNYSPTIVNSNQFSEMNEPRLIHQEMMPQQNAQTLPPLQSVPKGKVGPPQNRPVLPPLAILHKRIFSTDAQFPEPKRMKIGDLINSCT